MAMLTEILGTTNPKLGADARLAAQVSALHSARFGEITQLIETMRDKHGKASGTPYEEGVWDHSQRLIMLIRDMPLQTASEVEAIQRIAMAIEGPHKEPADSAYTLADLRERVWGMLDEREKRLRLVQAEAVYAETQGMELSGILAWAVEAWQLCVANRPLENIHRRSIDDTLRAVIRRAGGDPVSLVGPAHDDLLAAAKSEG